MSEVPGGTPPAVPLSGVDASPALSPHPASQTMPDLHEVFREQHGYTAELVYTDRAAQEDAVVQAVMTGVWQVRDQTSTSGDESAEVRGPTEAPHGVPVVGRRYLPDLSPQATSQTRSEVAEPETSMHARDAECVWTVFVGGLVPHLRWQAPCCDLVFAVMEYAHEVLVSCPSCDKLIRYNSRLGPPDTPLPARRHLLPDAMDQLKLDLREKWAAEQGVIGRSDLSAPLTSPDQSDDL